MRKSLLICLSFMMFWAVPATAASRPVVSIQSAYVVLKMDVARRQFLGASRLSIRNESGRTLTRLPVTLNSGLHIGKALDGNKQQLTVSEQLTKLQGAPEVQVNQATVTLATPLAPGDSMDLNLYYRGSFSPQYAGGIYGVGTPGPQFSLIQFWNFAYPAPAAANVDALTALYAASHYKADMQLEIPADLKVASALQVVGEKEAGGRKTVRLHGTRDLPPPMVAVGPYENAHFPGVDAFYMDGNGELAESLGVKLAETSKLLSTWLGAAPAGATTTVIDLPAGDGHATAPGFLALPLAYTPTADELTDLRQDMVIQWMPDAPTGDQGSWRAGLMSLAMDLANGMDMKAIKEAAFSAAKADSSGKSFSPATAKLMFCLIDDLAGEGGFRQMVGALRQTFTGISTKNSELAPYLVAHAPNKAVKKLVEHWMQDGKAQKTLQRAADYHSLLKKVD
ncbi:hypothetical protein [Kordiimonas marina]|uniref:hypothetical protein n=1 Tax=Kordiimonas marina TaxID=2872312 RepID=UPI001FF5826E|nr:hypothetical protein [Kordiimonas marina]MCJ9428325.1 hypothetical protein [Kordiimonas marina]